jgi:hypothetical protein
MGRSFWNSCLERMGMTNQPNYRVIALDPGGSTGWATYSAFTMQSSTGPTGMEYYDEKWTCGTLGPEEHHSDLYGLLEHMHVRDYTVVCESFEFRQNDGNRMGIELISREYIGVAKLFAQERKVPIKMQTAALAKKFVPQKGPEANKKLKAMGLYIPGKAHVHEMDAYRHLIYYLVNSKMRYDLIESWKDL